MPLLTRRAFGLGTFAGSAAVMLSRTVRAADADKIRVGILPLTSHAPTFIALGKDYFAKQGLAAEPVMFEASEPMGWRLPPAMSILA
jgi:NitT/TauT family transport system substrate-binding protein